MRPFVRRLALALGLGLTLVACTGAAPKASSEDMTLGNPNAKVTVIEYASVSCAHCARWNEEVWPSFRAQYVDTGRVHYVFKEFLTPPIEVASAGFLTARCAGRDKYFQVVDAIFRAQPVMFQTGDYRGELLRIANSAGLSEAQFTACIRDDEALKALNARVERAIKEDNISGTPTFIVNGKKVGEGEQTLAQLSAAIAEAEKAAK